MNTKIKCLLLDDELPGLSYLKLLCERISELEVVRTFNNPETFVRELPELEFDLCIMDIEMPGTSGIQLARMLKGKLIIFTTAYREYATDAFDLDAVDYVVKPVRFERLEQAVQKAIQRKAGFRPERKSARMNTDRGNIQLFFDQVIYIKTSEIDSRDKTTFLENGVSLQLKNISFEKLTALLPPEDFCRINKQELVALNRVLYFSNESIATNIFLSPEKPLILALGDAFRDEFTCKMNR